MALPDEIARCAALGWRMHPVSDRSRAAMFGDAVAKSSADLDTLAAWARQWPGCNWRVAVGASGLWALDVDAAGPDHAGDGLGAMGRYIARHGSLPFGPAIRTGGGGVCLFYRWQGERISGAPGTPCPGIDPRRGPLTVTLPPSRHLRTRARYEWIRPPWDAAPPRAPAWLLSLVAPPPPVQYPAPPSIRDGQQYDTIRNRLLDEIASAQPGTRNAMLNRNGFRLAVMAMRGRYDLASVRHDLQQVAQRAGIAWPEAKATIESALRGAVRAR